MRARAAARRRATIQAGAATGSVLENLQLISSIGRAGQMSSKSQASKSQDGRKRVGTYDEVRGRYMMSDYDLNGGADVKRKPAKIVLDEIGDMQIRRMGLDKKVVNEIKKQ